MTDTSEYAAILRCQTWNVWPENTVIEYSPFEIAYEKHPPVPVRLTINSYLNRTKAESYQQESTTIGPLIWDGEVPGLHLVRDTVLKAPEDAVEVKLGLRNTQRGEIDICINFSFTGELPLPLLEAVQATASAIMSLINLHVDDYLTPSAPLQVRKVGQVGASIESSVRLAVQNRNVLTQKSLEGSLSEIAHALAITTSQNSEKLRVALELYAAHFTERQARVRFLLLVMAMETLAEATRKHAIAIRLLERWHKELTAEMEHHSPHSEEFKSLEALSRELSFRAEDSIRSQVRKLFRKPSSYHGTAPGELERRALRVYDKRSTLVHDGYLPNDELLSLELEARELLEILFVSLTTKCGSGTLPSCDTKGG